MIRSVAALILASTALCLPLPGGAQDDLDAPAVAPDAMPLARAQSRPTPSDEATAAEESPQAEEADDGNPELDHLRAIDAALTAHLAEQGKKPVQEGGEDGPSRKLLGELNTRLGRQLKKAKKVALVDDSGGLASNLKLLNRRLSRATSESHTDSTPSAPATPVDPLAVAGVAAPTDPVEAAPLGPVETGAAVATMPTPAPEDPPPTAAPTRPPEIRPATTAVPATAVRRYRLDQVVVSRNGGEAQSMDLPPAGPGPRLIPISHTVGSVRLEIKLQTPNTITLGEPFLLLLRADVVSPKPAARLTFGGDELSGSGADGATSLEASARIDMTHRQRVGGIYAYQQSSTLQVDTKSLQSAVPYHLTDREPAIEIPFSLASLETGGPRVEGRVTFVPVRTEVADRKR